MASLFRDAIPLKINSIMKTPKPYCICKEKIRACYQHACLKYVSNEKMTNQSLRERFKIQDHNYSIASRIIRDAIEEGVLKEDDPTNKSRKYASYIPFWA